MEKNTKKNPVSKMNKEKNIVEELGDDNTEIYEEEDLQEVGSNESPAPTNEPIPSNITEAQMLLQFELKVRRLCEIETQLMSKKIALKNADSLTGVYSEQEMLSLAQTLKFETQTLIEYLKTNFKVEDAYFVEKFKEVEKGLKSYEYWVVAENRKKS